MQPDCEAQESLRELSDRWMLARVRCCLLEEEIRSRQFLQAFHVPHADRSGCKYFVWHHFQGVNTAYWYKGEEEAVRAIEVCQELDPTVWTSYLQTGSHPTETDSLRSNFPVIFWGRGTWFDKLFDHLAAKWMF